MTPTNAAGVEEFKSYGHAVLSQLFEAFLTLLNLVFLLGGTIAMILRSCLQSDEGMRICP